MTGRAKLFRYSGRSMWPGFQEGDLLEVSPAKTNEIRRGDCVAFHTSNKKVVTHRVVTTKDCIKTKGDALPAVDNEIIQPGQVIGKVVCIYRLGRPIRVWGGFPGRIVGHFYHYAGRIEHIESGRVEFFHSTEEMCTKLKAILSRKEPDPGE